jgi:hypothetical protein
VLSLAWAAAIVIIGLASTAVALLHERAGSKSSPDLLVILNWVVTIAILVFMVRFTAIYPDRVRKAAGVAEEPQPQPTDAPRGPSTSA